MPALRSFAPLFAVVGLGSAVVLAVVVAAPRPVAAAPQQLPADAGVEVQGVGTATGTPDVLHVTIGVESAGATVSEALASANGAARKVHDALHGAGVADADLQTVNVHLNPRFDGDGRHATGYLAGQDLAVTLRDVGSAGATISAAVEAGGDAARLRGVAYQLADDTALRSKARDKAFTAARAKAEQYAKLAGRALGDVVLMREQAHSVGPVPMAGDAGVASAGPVPLVPGSTDVSVTAEVRWSLK